MNNNLLNFIEQGIPVDNVTLGDIYQSNYFTHDTLIEWLSLINNASFSVLSLNCQSLYAKFDKLQLFIDSTDAIIIDKIRTHSLQGLSSYVKQYKLCLSVIKQSAQFQIAIHALILKLSVNCIIY